MNFIFALARPWLKSTSSKEASYIIILDNSASMQTVEANGRSRLEEAKKQVRALIDDMTYKQEMMILTFDNKAEIAVSFTGNRKKLSKVLDGIQAYETPTDITAALRIAKSVSMTRSAPRMPPDPGIGIPIKDLISDILIIPLIFLCGKLIILKQGKAY